MLAVNRHARSIRCLPVPGVALMPSLSSRLLFLCLRTILLLAKIVGGTILLVTALAAGLAALQGRIDWQDLKPKLGAMLTKATGRTVTLVGPLSVELLPWPALSADTVRLANAPGARSRSLLEVRRLGIRLSLQALMKGRIEFTHVVLDEPRLAIEPGADGQPNWWLPALATGSGADAGGPPLRLDRLEIRNGRLLHAIGLVDQPLEAHDVDLVVTMDAGSGHVVIRGTGLFNGVETSVAVAIRPGAVAGPPVAVATALPGGQFTFEGWLGERTAGDPMRGHMTVTTASPATFAASIAQMARKPLFRPAEDILRQADAAGDIVLDDRHLSIGGLALSIDDETVGGDLKVSAGEALLVEGRLSTAHLDLDRWMQRLRSHPIEADASTGQAGPTVPRLDLQIAIGEMRYRQDTVRDLSAAFSLDRTGWHVREARAVLPGDCRLYYRVGPGGEIEPGPVDGVDIDAHQLRKTLKWIGIDTESVPADRLQRLRVSGRTRVVADALEVADATFALDDQSGSGTARFALTLPTRITARLDMPRFDLDAYRLSEEALRRFIPSSNGTGGRQTVAIDPPSIDIGLTIDQVLYRGEPAHGVEAELTIRGNRLDLGRVAVASLLGARLDISGSVDDFASSPRIDLTWRGDLPDVDRMLDYAGLPRFAFGRIGAGRTSGHAVGTLNTVAIETFSIDMLDTRISAGGMVSFGDDLRFDFPRWSLDAQDIGIMVAAASGMPHRPLGRLEATGSLRGDSRGTRFQGDIALDGMRLRGDVASTLDRHPTVNLALETQEAVRLDRWLPAPPLSGAMQALNGLARPQDAAEPTWPSALKALDGSVSFTAPAVVWGPYEMVGSALSARLHEGRLTVENLAGMLGGASLRLSGSIDAQQLPVAIAIDGDLRDIDISRTIAVAHTANDFGSDDLAVALQGTITLQGVTLRAWGTTLDAMLRSLSGRGSSTGNIRPVVTRGSLSLATFATGIGSLFSTEMGFASTVIEGFVGRWVATRGALEIAEGTIDLREYLLQGERVTAVVSGRIDALRQDLDTRIDLKRPDGSTDYSMSLRGPLRAPMLTRDRSDSP